MSHARLSPSSASRWVNCPASVALSEQFPETGRNEAAEEGTASHWVASEILLGRPAPAPGAVCPENGIVLTQEMVDCAMVFVEAVRESSAGLPIAVETKMQINSIHPQCFGTADTWFFDPNTATLHIWDYKYGFGLVDPVENWQLMCYAAGALQQCPTALHIVLHIVQPRPFHMLGPVRSWRVPVVEFVANYLARLRTAAAQAVSANPETRTGHHCQYCKARHACPTLALACYAAIDYVGQAQAELLPVEAMALEYRILERIEGLVKARKKAHESRMIAMLSQPNPPEMGYRLEHGKGRQKWTRPAKEIINMGKLMGVDLAAPPEAITPAQAKKLLDKSLLDRFTEIPTTGYTLVPTTGTLAASVFKVPLVTGPTIPSEAEAAFGRPF